ncbi:SRPBCC family protein [Prescottella agglutinans]|uniref:SRPBCC family protein n=1 Tax=Prescottella agglutinans TaxID=1644129 RepID=A0A438BGH2_9NOCA|nr:SRPBCC family protein [Prescottella agglutinans]RVW10074.1 SRPBCC family protein [Prescottella agglutinans]
MTNTLEASIEIAATPQDVWTIVSDLKRMGEWSPQCRKMRVSGEVREGTKTFNINRKGLLVWPTTSKVIRFEPNKAIAFRINENRSIWSYTLEPTETGTRVVERREAPTGTSQLSQFLIKTVLGGADAFETEMVAGMNATLARIKQEAEALAVDPR